MNEIKKSENTIVRALWSLWNNPCDDTKSQNDKSSSVISCLTDLTQTRENPGGIFLDTLLGHHDNNEIDRMRVKRG